MPVRAFVLIQTEVEVARTAEVVVALKKQGEEIKSVDRVTGPYDIIALLEAGSLDEIGTIIDSKIQSVAGVYKTITCLAI